MVDAVERVSALVQQISSATREQMAVMIARFCRRLNVWNEPMPEL